MGFIATGTIRSQVLAGTVKSIAMAEGQASPDMPQVPDLMKALPGFQNIPIFAALWAPAGTPRDIVERLNKVMTDALKSPDIRGKIAEGGQIPTGRSIAETAKAVAQNVDVATRLVNQAKAAGVKFD